MKTTGCAPVPTSIRQPLITVLWALPALALLHSWAFALDGDIRVHDPSTVIVCDGRYFIFSTGRGIPIHSSDDGWTWKRAGRVLDGLPQWIHELVPLNTNAVVWAPDVMKRNGQYYLYYSVSTWGSSVSAIGLLTSPTLDVSDPQYKWTDRGLIIHSVKGQRLNTIDPGVLQAPDGTLWLSYGSYIGDVEVVQLDPKTGLRIANDSPTYDLSSASEASDIIYHDGFYYLFVNRGSCCQGVNSTYNIRMGRCKTVTGPYLDSRGHEMAHGGGDLFLASSKTQIGPGHFGRLIEDGVEKFSCHYEADLSRHTPVLDIRPLLWGKDGWPSAGVNLADGVYQIRSSAGDSNLQSTATGVELQPPAVGDNQKWELKRHGVFFTIATPGGKAFLQAAATTISLGAELSTDNELWKIDQTPDGTFRIESKADHLSLTIAAPGTSHIGLATDRWDKMQRWSLDAQ